MTDAATPREVGSTEGLGPDGKLHADGYFTWHRRDGYVLDAKLPAEFVLAEKVHPLNAEVTMLRELCRDAAQRLDGIAEAARLYGVPDSDLLARRLDSLRDALVA